MHNQVVLPIYLVTGSGLPPQLLEGQIRLRTGFLNHLTWVSFAKIMSTWYFLAIVSTTEPFDLFPKPIEFHAWILILVALVLVLNNWSCLSIGEIVRAKILNHMHLHPDIECETSMTSISLQYTTPRYRMWTICDPSSTVVHNNTETLRTNYKAAKKHKRSLIT